MKELKYIKKQMASHSMFYKVLKPSVGKDIKGAPHYFMNIGSAETFEQKLDEAERNFTLSEKIRVSYVIKPSWFWDAMAWVLSVVLILSLWSILLRGRSGNGMGKGASSVFNFGKSTAAVFYNKNKNTVKF